MILRGFQLMAQLLILVALLVHQTPVGPEDAFRANFSAIRANVRYRVQASLAAPIEALEELRAWTSAEVSFVEHPRFGLDIEWTCDGAAQHVICRSASASELTDAAAPAANNDPPTDGSPGGVMRPANFTAADKGFEVLWDGEIQVEHRLDLPDVQVHVGDAEGMLYTTSGPFLWWGILKYPSHLRVNFPKSVPIVHRATLGGRELVVAVYEDEFDPNGWARLEVWHDPAVEYLPRFARYVVGYTSAGRCREYFLVDAKPCSHGGYVPTKVYEANFDIDPPKRLLASEFDGRAPAPRPRSQIHMRRLEATEFRDSKEAVHLEKLENVKTIAAKGGSVPLGKGVLLTLERLKSLLGRKLTDPAPLPLPAIDYAELQEFTAEPTRIHWLFYCLGIPLAVGFGALCLWRCADGEPL